MDPPACACCALNEQIDLLITDVGLPGMNGRQLADQARETRPGLKILFITGYAESVAIADGFLQPGMEMITKPFDLDHLSRRDSRDDLGVVLAYLSHKGRGSAPPPPLQINLICDAPPPAVTPSR